VPEAEFNVSNTQVYTVGAWTVSTAVSRNFNKMGKGNVVCTSRAGMCSPKIITCLTNVEDSHSSLQMA